MMIAVMDYCSDVNQFY